jgi:hypothetical protein
MELTRITTLLFASTSLLFNLVHADDGPVANLTLYDNECYGDIIDGSYTSYLGEAGGGWPFPSGHFMSTGDGCGESSCMGVSYDDITQCKGYYFQVGSGCKNINVGFQPRSLNLHCVNCDSFPEGPYNSCDEQPLY